MTAAIRVILKRGRSKPFWVGHPWVFSGAIHRVDGTVGEMGGPCVVVDERDNILGAGFYNPHAKIAVRILEHRRGTELDFTPRALPDLARQRLSSAIARRKLHPGSTGPVHGPISPRRASAQPASAPPRAPRRCRRARSGRNPYGIVREWREMG